MFAEETFLHYLCSGHLVSYIYNSFLLLFLYRSGETKISYPKKSCLVTYFIVCLSSAVCEDSRF